MRFVRFFFRRLCWCSNLLYWLTRRGIYMYCIISFRLQRVDYGDEQRENSSIYHLSPKCECLLGAWYCKLSAWHENCFVVMMMPHVYKDIKSACAMRCWHVMNFCSGKWHGWECGHPKEYRYGLWDLLKFDRLDSTYIC